MTDPNNTVALAAIALAGAITAGMFKQLSSNTKTQNKLSKSMDSLTASNKRIADEAKTRNGHLGDTMNKIAELVVTTADKQVNVQTVETQVIKEQK